MLVLLILFLLALLLGGVFGPLFFWVACIAAVVWLVRLAVGRDI